MLCGMQNHIVQAFANSGNAIKPVSFIRDLRSKWGHTPAHWLHGRAGRWREGVAPRGLTGQGLGGPGWLCTVRVVVSRLPWPESVGTALEWGSARLGVGDCAWASKREESWAMASRRGLPCW